MGPLTAQQAGRMWAKAFIDGTYKAKVEKSPLNAAVELFQQPITPLFDWTKSYLPIFFETLGRQTDPFSALDIQNILDNKFAPLSQEKRKALRDSLIGNRFSLLNKRDITEPSHDLYPQNMMGPSGPTDPLLLSDWIRIYTKAFTDQTGFLVRLTEDPAKAVDEFRTAHGLSHVSTVPPTTPIFELPMLSELLAIIPPGNPLRDTNTLANVLTRIANGVEQTYEANLKVNLCC